MPGGCRSSLPFAFEKFRGQFVCEPMGANGESIRCLSIRPLGANDKDTRQSVQSGNGRSDGVGQCRRCFWGIADKVFSSSYIVTGPLLLVNGHCEGGMSHRQFFQRALQTHLYYRIDGYSIRVGGQTVKSPSGTVSRGLKTAAPRITCRVFWITVHQVRRVGVSPIFTSPL